MQSLVGFRCQLLRNAKSSPRHLAEPLPSDTWRRQPLRLDLHVLIGGECAHPHLAHRVLGDAWADADQRAQIHDRRKHRPVDRELLNLVEQHRALVAVPLGRLLLVQFIDFGIAAKVRPALLLTGEPAADELDLITFCFIRPRCEAIAGN